MSRNALLASAAVAAVVIAIVAGLILVGTPGEQRLRRLDGQRIGDLRRLVVAIDRFWDDTGALPPTLELLVDGRRLSRLPRDPATEADYEYRVIEGSRYELCANFDRPSAESDDFWSHGDGEKCFSFDAATSNRWQRLATVRSGALDSAAAGRF